MRMTQAGKRIPLLLQVWKCGRLQDGDGASRNRHILDTAIITPSSVAITPSSVAITPSSVAIASREASMSQTWHQSLATKEAKRRGPSAGPAAACLAKAKAEDDAGGTAAQPHAPARNRPKGMSTYASVVPTTVVADPSRNAGRRRPVS
eukprot:365332-Chlamydomonas_euryale.AAC.2